MKGHDESDKMSRRHRGSFIGAKVFIKTGLFAGPPGQIFEFGCSPLYCPLPFTVLPSLPCDFTKNQKQEKTRFKERIKTPIIYILNLHFCVFIYSRSFWWHLMELAVWFLIFFFLCCIFLLFLLFSLRFLAFSLLLTSFAYKYKGNQSLL